MRKVKKVGAFILAAVYVIGLYLCFLTGVALLSTGQVDAELAIDRPEEMEYYDPKVEIEEASEDVLLDGIDYEMSFLQYDNSHGTAKRIKDLNRKVADSEEFYKVSLRVKNNTAEELSGVKFFVKLPDSIGERSVVGDKMTLTAKLEYDGVVAQKQLNLIGENSPIAVVFPSGSAGYIWKGDAEGEKLPVYEEDVEISPFDYWQNEGFELNVPAGEEWQLYVSVDARVVADFQVETKISSVDGKYSGKKLSTTTIFGRKKRFHVVTEIANPTNIEEPTNIWTSVDPGVNLVPGSVRLNGEQIDDFLVERDQYGFTDFKTTDLGINMPHKVMTLEYDIELNPEMKGESTRGVYVRSLVHVGAVSASTAVGCLVFNGTIALALMAPAIISIAIEFSVYIIRRTRRKHAE